MDAAGKVGYRRAQSSILGQCNLKLKLSGRKGLVSWPTTCSFQQRGLNEDEPRMGSKNVAMLNDGPCCPSRSGISLGQAVQSTKQTRPPSLAHRLGKAVPLPILPATEHTRHRGHIARSPGRPRWAIWHPLRQPSNDPPLEGELCLCLCMVAIRGGFFQDRHSTATMQRQRPSSPSSGGWWVAQCMPDGPPRTATVFRHVGRWPSA